MAKAVDLVGIAKSDAAQRLALFLPILASFTIFGESSTLAKGVGIVLAFASLIALTYKPQEQSLSSQTPSNLKKYRLDFGRGVAWLWRD